MAYDFNLTRIDNTDTFKEWADKCNAIIDGLNTTDFITNSDSLMTLGSTQTVTGHKTFTLSTTFNNGLVSTGTITSNGNFTFDGTTGIINTPTLQVNSGSFTTGSGFEVIGSKGISFKSSSTASVASLKFENAGTPEKIVFDYTGAGEGIFEIADGNKLSLAGSSPTIGVNNYEWDLPATSPGSTPSLLKWSGTGSQLEWLGQSSFATTILADVIAGLQESNFTLPVTLIPVGTMVAVDARILDNWPEDLNGLSSPENYGILNTVPGWIPCAGQTLSFDDTESSPIDTEFKELIELLEGIDSPNGSTTLPDTIGSPGEEDPIGGNSIVYLIKYKSDDSTIFSVATTTGVAGASGINLFDTSDANVGSFDITGGKIGLNIDTGDFEFGSGGELSLVDDIDTAATADTLAKRDSAGALTVATPTADGHATTKGYVDTSVNTLEDTITNELKGSVRSFPELIDGHQSYADRKESMTFVDRYGRGVFSGLQSFERSGTNAPDSGGNFPNGWFNTFSPITDQEATFERTFHTPDNFFFIDDNDVLYGSGRNSEGQIGQRDRGTGTDFTDYYTQFHSPLDAIYNETTIETPIPAMLPQKSEWDANAVTVDTVSYTRNPHQPGILVKTKDGVGRNYISNQRIQGLVKYETDENAVGFGGANVPYTRGWLIISSENDNGNTGDGTVTQTSYTTTGPQVFGLGGAGSSLWATFAATDAERTSGINALNAAQIAQLNKRFHYFKENATKAGGLGATDEAAFTEWRSQLGLPDDSPGALFDHYSYYIKKSVIEGYGTWLIVGKPGNESDNELWFAGYNGVGQGGNGTTSSVVSRHVPALDFGSISTLNVKSDGEADNKVFISHDGNSPEVDAVHGFEDFEQISIGTSRYYIIRGDASNENLTTRFRLFSDDEAAYNALISGGTTSAYRDAAISSRVLRHHQKLKGIFDISVGSEGDGHTPYNHVLARRTTDTTTSATELDALPESEFDSVTVMSWGRNNRGQLGLGNTNDARTPHTVSVGTADRPVDIIAVSCGRNSFIVTEDSSDNRSIRIAGNNFRGLADVGTQTGNTTTFTLSSTIDANWWVKKVFVSAGPQFSEKYLGYIFIVAQSKTNSNNYALFAGGYNNWTQFGTSQLPSAATLNYIRIPFPEDPKNIVAMQNSHGSAYFALCKTEESGETAEEFAAKAGRVYGAGWAHYRLGNTHLRQKPSWHPVDGQILST